MQQVLIHYLLLKKTDLAHLKSDLDKLDCNELKNVSSNLNNLKSTVDNLDTGKLEATQVGLSKQSNIVKNDVVRKDVYSADLENAAGVGTSSFAKTTDLSNLKPDVDKLDIDKLKNVPRNLSNSRNKANKLDVDKLVPVPVDLSKLGVVAKSDIDKDLYIMLR